MVAMLPSINNKGIGSTLVTNRISVVAASSGTVDLLWTRTDERDDALPSYKSATAVTQQVMQSLTRLSAN